MLYISTTTTSTGQKVGSHLRHSGSDGSGEVVVEGVRVRGHDEIAEELLVPGEGRRGYRAARCLRRHHKTLLQPAGPINLRCTNYPNAIRTLNFVMFSNVI